MFLNPFFTTTDNLNTINQTPNQLTGDFEANNSTQNNDPCCETKNDFAKNLNEEMLLAYLFNSNANNINPQVSIENTIRQKNGIQTVFNESQKKNCLNSVIVPFANWIFPPPSGAISSSTTGAVATRVIDS